MYKKYWKDVFYQASGNTLAQFIGVLSLPVLTRLYSPPEFAVLNLFLQSVLFLNIFTALRYEYFINLAPTSDEVFRLLNLIFLLGIAISMIAFPIIFFISEPISIFLNQPNLSDWLILAPLSALILAYVTALQHFHQREENYQISGISEIINKIGYSLSGITGFFLFLNGFGLIFAQIIGPLIKGLYLIFIKRSISLNKIFFIIRPLNAYKKIINKYSSRANALILAHSMLSITTLMPMFFISRSYGSETLGQFGLVLSTLYLPSSLIANAIGQVYFQRSAKDFSQGNSFRYLWKETAKKLLMIGLPIYLGIAILSPLAYPLIFGSAWTKAGEYAVLISISSFFSFISDPLDKSCLIINNKTWYIIFWHFLRVITTLAVILICWKFAFNFEIFLLLLVIQMALLYVINYFMNYHFTREKYLS